jgi:hypothetical protein
MKETQIYAYRAKTAEHKISLQVLKDCHAFLENKLGVKTSLYLVKEKKTSQLGAFNPKLNAILINFHWLKGSTIQHSINILSHEMRHAVQYKNKWIKDFIGKTDTGYWKGKKYDVGYYDSPWEIDARKYEDKYAKSAIDSLNLKRKLKIKI